METTSHKKNVFNAELNEKPIEAFVDSVEGIEEITLDDLLYL
ncbi:Uncharacterised protein [Chromobacterium vaccinii]|nr:Uncharacterised protein [Chromobacterium vaccinii]